MHPYNTYIILYVLVPFEFTIQKMCSDEIKYGNLDLLIYTRSVRSPFSRPIYNENALRERIKAIFFSFNLCDTVRTSYIYIYIIICIIYIILLRPTFG